jgi:hypothetical protein
MAAPALCSAQLPVAPDMVVAPRVAESAVTAQLSPGGSAIEYRASPQARTRDRDAYPVLAGRTGHNGYGPSRWAMSGAPCDPFVAGHCGTGRLSTVDYRPGASAVIAAEAPFASQDLTAPLPESSSFGWMFVGFVIIGAAVRRRCNDQE